MADRLRTEPVKEQDFPINERLALLSLLILKIVNPDNTSQQNANVYWRHRRTQNIFHNNLKSPDTASNRGIGGKVVISFIVGKDGFISNVEVSQSSNNPELDAEGWRVVKSFPK